VGLELPLAAAFFSAAERGRMRTAGMVALLLITGTTTIRIFLDQDPVILLALQVPIQMAVLGGAIGAGDAVHSRGQRDQQRAERSRLLAAERAAEARSLVEAERRALAREVHDVLGHSMVLIRLQAEVALDALEDHEQVRSSLTEIRATAQGGLADIRQSLQVLAPTEREPRDPVATTALLPDVVERMRTAGLAVEYAEHGSPQPMPIATDATAYRIVQEALTNVLKHAPGARTRVDLAYGPGLLEIRVTDSGPFSGQFVAGAGIIGLRERTAMIGGRLDAGADPDDNGFRVLAQLPLGAGGIVDQEQPASGGQGER
jgi:signal transduction histidine kinase